MGTLIDTIDTLIKKEEILEEIYIFVQDEEFKAKTFGESNAYAKIVKKLKELKELKEIK